MLTYGYDKCAVCGKYVCSCGDTPEQPPEACPPTPPSPCPPDPDPPKAQVACQMIPYFSGTVPLILASVGLDFEKILEDMEKIPVIGEEIHGVIQKALERLNSLLESLGLPPLAESLACGLIGNLGLGSWTPDLTCKEGKGLLPPQASAFTACQSGYVCGLNAAFANLATVNLDGKVAYITAHVETRPASCAGKDEQEWTDITPIDPNTGKPGLTLTNQGENAYCACGDGILPLGALGNTYTTPGCSTVKFCKDESRINCGDLVRVTFKATPKEGTEVTALLAVGYGSAGLCIMPDPAIDDDCGCGCPCDNGYKKPACPSVECKCADEG